MEAAVLCSSLGKAGEGYRGCLFLPAFVSAPAAFPRKFEPRSHLLQREKLIKLMIQGSFIQNLAFLLEALIKTIADQSAAKHLLGGTVPPPPLIPLFVPIPLSSAAPHRSVPGPVLLQEPFPRPRG